jgi:hypothetical protein
VREIVARGNLLAVKIAAIAFFVLFVVLPLGVVSGLFVWAAIGDGRRNREVREQLETRGRD